jgi:hypothetical protein
MEKGEWKPFRNALSKADRKKFGFPEFYFFAALIIYSFMNHQVFPVFSLDPISMRDILIGL